MCTVRRERLDLFLQVVCRRGQWQAEEGVFSPTELFGDELTFLVTPYKQFFIQTFHQVPPETLSVSNHKPTLRLVTNHQSICTVSNHFNLVTHLTYCLLQPFTVGLSY